MCRNPIRASASHGRLTKILLGPSAYTKRVKDTISSDLIFAPKGPFSRSYHHVRPSLSHTSVTVCELAL